MENQVRTTVIDSKSLRLLEARREVGEYRELLFELVKREIRVRYAQTVLGLGWAFMRPLVSVLVFTIVFGIVVGVPSDGVPYAVFAFAALLPWSYFSQALAESTNSLVVNSGMLSKVYFPRIILPIVPVISGILDFGISLAMLFLLLLIYQVELNFSILVVPMLLMLMVGMTLGLSLFFSAIAVHYRDVRQAIQFGIQFLMYLVPVLWPLSKLEAKFPGYETELLYIVGLFPMVTVIEGMRACLLGTRDIPWGMIVEGYVVVGLVLIGGAKFFLERERVFADVV